MEKITSFSGKYKFLSNFSPAPVVMEGETFPTVEHAYQAAKTLDPQQRARIQLAKSPGMAKGLGRAVSLRDDWESIKVDIMRNLLRQKFGIPDLQSALLATGEAVLLEGNTWGDKFWGCVWVNGEWMGQNNLGKLLMEIRQSLYHLLKLTI